MVQINKKPFVIDFIKGRFGTYLGVKTDAAEPRLLHPVILPIGKLNFKKNYEVFPETVRPESIGTFRPPMTPDSKAIMPEIVVILESSSGERPFMEMIGKEFVENIEKIKQQSDALQMDLATQKYKAGQATEESSKKLQREMEQKQARSGSYSSYGSGSPFRTPWEPMSFEDRLRNRIGHSPEEPNDWDTF